MVMHTETALRIPAWLIAVLVVAGVALGLWQVAVFGRSSDGDRGANTVATASQSRAVTGRASVDATAGESASASNRANFRADERPITTIDPLAGDPDPEVRAESDALQAALAAEQASH